MSYVQLMSSFTLIWDLCHLESSVPVYAGPNEISYIFCFPIHDIPQHFLHVSSRG